VVSRSSGFPRMHSARVSPSISGNVQVEERQPERFSSALRGCRGPPVRARRLRACGYMSKKVSISAGPTCGGVIVHDQRANRPRALIPTAALVARGFVYPKVT